MVGERRDAQPLFRTNVYLGGFPTGCSLIGVKNTNYLTLTFRAADKSNCVTSVAIRMSQVPQHSFTYIQSPLNHESL